MLLYFTVTHASDFEFSFRSGKMNQTKFYIVVGLICSLCFPVHGASPTEAPRVRKVMLPSAEKTETCESLVIKEAVLVHSLFRLLREQVAIFNAVSARVASRKGRRAHDSHPEILDHLDDAMLSAKGESAHVLQLVKGSKKIVKMARVESASNTTATSDLLKESNALLLVAIGRAEAITELVNDDLVHQKSGLYSRKQKIGTIVGDAPDRLGVISERFKSMTGQVSSIGASLEVPCQ